MDNPYELIADFEGTDRAAVSINIARWFLADAMKYLPASDIRLLRAMMKELYAIQNQFEAGNRKGEG